MTGGATAWRARAATPDDAPAIAGIYNQGIEHRVGTFETEPRSPADIAAWFERGLPIVASDYPRTGAGAGTRAPGDGKQTRGEV